MITLLLQDKTFKKFQVELRNNENNVDYNLNNENEINKRRKKNKLLRICKILLKFKQKFL